ncbi:hypothetical protein [Nocardia sp. Marseille-Q1738]
MNRSRYTPRLTAIIPCGGAGTRFGAPYPKELHCLEPGVTVLDRSIEPLLDLAAAGVGVRLVMVVDPGRHATIAHLGGFADRLEVVVVLEAADSPRGAGSAVQRALPMCTGPVLVMMPDQFFDRNGADNPVARALALLDNGSGVNGNVVLAASIDDPAELRCEGALAVIEDRNGPTVAAAAEKPDNPSGFNAVWAAVLCAPQETDSLWRLFDRSVPSPLVGASVVMVGGYQHVTRPGRY